jgi:hypothetical protein
MSWIETKDVLSVGVGPAIVWAWVEIVDPENCGEYGCDNIELGGETRLQVVK